MHKSQLGAIIIDCQTETLPEQADFWSLALGLKPGRSDGRYIHLEGKDEDLVVTLQKVEHPSRVHIDIETDDIDAEV